MKRKTLRMALFTAALVLLFAIAFAMKFFSFHTKSLTAGSHDVLNCTAPSQPCVMKTAFGLENDPATLVNLNMSQLPKEAQAAISNGLVWISKAQGDDGSWGSGTHARQDLMDPHGVPGDPATTALVSMSLLRTGSNLTEGKYSEQLKKATLFLLNAVEQWKQDQPSLTSLTGTQPQVKLGQNIDAIVTAQFFTHLLRYHPQHEWSARIKKDLGTCVQRIQKEQDVDGGWKGGGWAPVLQSALADNALESAQDIGVTVDSTVLKRSKDYQKGNFDTATKSALTGSAAGVMLYSFSSTNLSSAKEAKKAKDVLERAKKEGKLDKDAKLTEGNLQTAGLSPIDAKEKATAYFINENTKQQSLRDDVMSGFGSNGGEEFLSYLMTGQAIVIQGGDEWKSWYELMSKKIINIQNPDGSWQGHHCITSPVFCTATCLLILSIQTDMDMKLPG